MQVIQGTNSGHKELISTQPSKSIPFVLSVIIIIATLCYLFTHVSIVFVIILGSLVTLSAISEPKEVKIGKMKLMGSIILHIILVIALGYTLDLNNYKDTLTGIIFYWSALTMTLNAHKYKQNKKQQEKKEKNE